jgi:hypothetical protein
MPPTPAELPVPDDRPQPTAQHLVAAWVDGYRERRHVDPHPNTIRRVAGQAKSLAKDCSKVEDWRRAWQACLAAGRAGRIDPGPFLIDEQPRSLYRVKAPSLSIEESVRAAIAGQAVAREIEG